MDGNSIVMFNLISHLKRWSDFIVDSHLSSIRETPLAHRLLKFRKTSSKYFFHREIEHHEPFGVNQELFSPSPIELGNKRVSLHLFAHCYSFILI